VTSEYILSEYEGRDEPEKIRNYLISKFPENPKKEFVLLVGSMDRMPMRVASVDPDDHEAEGYQVPTDFYYEELTCNWDKDGDGFYGEYDHDMTKSDCDYKAEALVGRLPWDDPQVVQKMVDTIIAYETNGSNRMKTMIGVGAELYDQCDSAFFLETAKTTYMKASGYAVTSIYENCPAFNPDMELTRENFLRTWEALEPGIVTWFSHGSSYKSYYGSDPWTFIDTDNLPEVENPAIVIGSGCTQGNPEEESLGRVLLRDGIAVAFFGITRPNWAGDNWIPAFTAEYSIGINLVLYRQALSESITNGIEYYVRYEQPVINTTGKDFHRNIFELIVYGDPAIQVK